MRALSLAFLCAAVASLALASPAAAAMKNCGFVSFNRDPSVANGNGGTVYTSGMTCRAARREVRRWVTSGRTAVERGWRCRRTTKTDAYGSTVHYDRCTKTGRVITMKIYDL